MVDKIRFFCQKVIPLVYDDSLSYYECLCKVRDKVNECIEQLNGVDERVTVLEETFDAFDTRLDSAEEDIDNCESDIDSLEGRMDTAEGDIDSLEGRMTTEEGKTTNLQGRMTTAEGNITTLQTFATNTAPKVEKLPSSLGTAGQVLTVNSGATAAEWKNPPEELPSVVGNIGKFLGVDSQGRPAWSAVAGGNLPAITSGDAGKVLTVNQAEDGAVWAEGSGDFVYLDVVNGTVPSPSVFYDDIKRGERAFLRLHRQSGDGDFVSFEDTILAPLFMFEKSTPVESGPSTYLLGFIDVTGEISGEIDTPLGAPPYIISVAEDANGVVSTYIESLAAATYINLGNQNVDFDSVAYRTFKTPVYAVYEDGGSSGTGTWLYPLVSYNEETETLIFYDALGSSNKFFNTSYGANVKITYDDTNHWRIAQL